MFITIHALNVINANKIQSTNGANVEQNKEIMDNVLALKPAIHF